MAVHLKQVQFSYMCVQQEMPMKKEEEAWLLGLESPVELRVLLGGALIPAGPGRLHRAQTETGNSLKE